MIFLNVGAEWKQTSLGVHFHTICQINLCQYKIHSICLFESFALLDLSCNTDSAALNHRRVFVGGPNPLI